MILLKKKEQINQFVQTLLSSRNQKELEEKIHITPTHETPQEYHHSFPPPLPPGLLLPQSVVKFGFVVVYLSFPVVFPEVISEVVFNLFRCPCDHPVPRNDLPLAFSELLHPLKKFPEK